MNVVNDEGTGHRSQNMHDSLTLPDIQADLIWFHIDSLMLSAPKKPQIKVHLTPKSLLKSSHDESKFSWNIWESNFKVVFER